MKKKRVSYEKFFIFNIQLSSYVIEEISKLKLKIEIMDAVDGHDVAIEWEMGHGPDIVCGTLEA